MTKRKHLYSADELAEAAEKMGHLLEAIPADEDSPRDAAVRRRVEGAAIAARLASGRTSH